MPGSLGNGHILDKAAVPANQKMSRDFAIRDLGKIGMLVGRQGIGKQSVYPRASELSGRQRDAMDDNEAGLTPGRALIAIRRFHLPRLKHEPAFTIQPVHSAVTVRQEMPDGRPLQ